MSTIWFLIKLVGYIIINLIGFCIYIIYIFPKYAYKWAQWANNRKTIKLANKYHGGDVKALLFSDLYTKPLKRGLLVEVLLGRLAKALINTCTGIARLSTKLIKYKS